MRTLTPLSIVALLLFAILSLCVFTVYETDRAMILRLGKLQTAGESNQPKVYEPGFHFKLPIIDTVRHFDTRLNMLEVHSRRIVTSEKKDVIVSFFIQWRIADIALFYTRTDGRQSKAEALLEQKVIDGLRAEFGRRTILEVVSGERVELMQHLLVLADENASSLGITVKDVRIKQIDLPTEVSEAVYDRMRSERERVASEFRAKGEQQANIIRANAEKERRILLAEAARDAQRIRGEGDAQAVEIYARTYNESPEFYEFLRSIEAYQNTFHNKNDVLILRPDGDFFKYFNGKEGS